MWMVSNKAKLCVISLIHIFLQNKTPRTLSINTSSKHGPDGTTFPLDLSSSHGPFSYGTKNCCFQSDVKFVAEELNESELPNCIFKCHNLLFIFRQALSSIIKSKVHKPINKKQHERWINHRRLLPLRSWNDCPRCQKSSERYAFHTTFKQFIHMNSRSLWKDRCLHWSPHHTPRQSLMWKHTCLFQK